MVDEGRRDESSPPGVSAGLPLFMELFLTGKPDDDEDGCRAAE
jgi:hypothetical protein